MSKPVDLELKKAFVELQFKMSETSKTINALKSQIEVLKKVLKHVVTTQREINSLPPGIRTYESVGRMFLLTDIDVVKSNLKTRESKLSSKTSELQNKIQHLGKNLKESEDNIREMVQQKKVQIDTKSN